MLQFSVNNWSLRDRLTAGILILSAFGFIGAGIGSQTLLRDYLINQLDEQLLSIVGETSDQLDRAGIEDTSSQENAREFSDSAATPLDRVPTSISVTVLDPFGNLVGGL